MKLSLDSDSAVYFYEQEFYPLSNFSAFSIVYDAVLYFTAEHAYQAQKFNKVPSVREMIRCAMSAHDAFKLAQQYKNLQAANWGEVKVDVMRDIIGAKAEQHEYVRRKLLETGNRELIENSWRDDYWGWGENRDGQNQLGKLWMELRAKMLVERLKGGGK